MVTTLMLRGVRITTADEGGESCCWISMRKAYFKIAHFDMKVRMQLAMMLEEFQTMVLLQEFI
jgi:hypothetical protein